MRVRDEAKESNITAKCDVANTYESKVGPRPPRVVCLPSVRGFDDMPKSSRGVEMCTNSSSDSKTCNDFTNLFVSSRVGLEHEKPSIGWFNSSCNHHIGFQDCVGPIRELK
jgi:hypothetical protein